jgi:WD40 repeat protein/serine/threonine protein kinase
MLAGELTAAVERGVTAHVETCVPCQRLLEELTAVSRDLLADRPPALRPSSGRFRHKLSDEQLHRLRDLLPPGSGAPAADGAFPEPPGKADWPNIPGYEIRRELGRGGMAVVYEARHLRLNRPVALKMILAGELATPEQLVRFCAEAEVVAGLRHPNIVQIYEVGTHNRQPYFALELMEDGSLAEAQAGKPWPARAAAELVETVAHAMDYAHLQGIVHRDLKPANILLSGEGRGASGEKESPSSLATRHSPLAPVPKVADFGLAKHLDQDSRLTKTGHVMGTPGYMAPEQVCGQHDRIGPRTDVYALGAILYELLTGRPPFQAPTSLEVMNQVTALDPVPPSRLLPHVPRDLEVICLKCLEKAPERRYAGAAALADDLRRFLGGEPIRARRVAKVERAWRWARRRPAVAGLLLAVLVVAVLGFAAVLWQWRQAVASAAALRQERDHARRQAYLANLKAASSALASQNVNLAQAALEAAPREYRGWEWRHFHSRLDSMQAILRTGIPPGQATFVEAAYQGQVKNIALSPDGKTIAAGATDQTVQLWDGATGKPAGSLAGHAGPVTAVAISPDGTRLVSRVDNTLYLWDLLGRNLIAVLRGHCAPISTFDFSSESHFLISGSADDPVIRLWDAQTGSALQTFTLPARGCHYLKWGPDGQSVAAVANEGRRTLWLIETKTGNRKPVLPDVPIWSVTFSPDAGTIACGATWPDSRVRLLEARSGKLLFVLAGHNTRVSSLAFSPDGSRLVSASMDQTARLWEVATGKLLAVLRGHSHKLYEVQFSPDGAHVLTASQDKTIRIWDGRTGELIAIVLGHRAGVRGIALNRAGTLLVSEDDQGEVRLCDLKCAAFQGILRGHKSFVYDAVFSPDGRWVASIAWDNTVRLWDPVTGRQQCVLSGSGASTTGVAFHPSGRQVASVSNDKGICLWDVSAEKPRGPLPVESGTAAAVKPAFHPDGSILTAGSRDGVVRFWDPRNGRLVAELARQTSAAKSVCFNRDGSLLASAWADGMVRLWDVRSRTIVASFQGHRRGIEAVTFSPDGQWLASASGDGTVRIWDVTSHKQLALLNHASEVYGVAFSPDGARLASACADHIIRLWDVQTWEEIAHLAGHVDYVHSVVFSPDGSRLVSGSGDFTVRLWDTEPPAHRADARRAAAALTP